MACSHTVSEDFLFCPYCGQKQERKVCQCLQINPEHARFCARCGNELTETLEFKTTTQKTENKTLGRYNLEELAALAKNDPDAACVVKNVKISQDDINAIFNRKTPDDSK